MRPFIIVGSWKFGERIKFVINFKSFFFCLFMPIPLNVTDLTDSGQQVNISGFNVFVFLRTFR